LVQGNGEILAKVDEIVKSKRPLKKELEKLLDEIRSDATKEVAKGWKQR